MAVSGVNNSNSNTGYVVGAATLGAGAGVATGYLTKPFLKDGAPTDSFIKKIGENILADLPKDVKEGFEATKDYLKKAEKSINDAKSVEELKANFMKFAFEGIDESNFEDMKGVTGFVAEGLEAMGLKVDPTFKNIAENVQSLDDMKKVVSESFDKTYAGKSVDEIKQTIKAETDAINRKTAKAMFEEFWDSNKKTFVDCEDGLGKAVKKAAKSIQGKYAAIYGAIGAGVLGLGAYLLTNNNKKS